MEALKEIFNSNNQAQWRTKIQWSAVFFASLAILVLVSAFYVNTSTRTALAGRKIALVESNIQTIEQEITDMEATLASLQSVQVMQSRAEALGFLPAKPGDFIYISVAGYNPPSEVILAPKTHKDQSPIILPEYTESLIDWLFTSWGNK